MDVGRKFSMFSFFPMLKYRVVKMTTIRSV